MKIRRVRLKHREAHCAVVYKTKCFKTEREAREWAQFVDRLLAAAAAAQRMGMTPQEAVEVVCGSGSAAA